MVNAVDIERSFEGGEWLLFSVFRRGTQAMQMAIPGTWAFEASCVEAELVS